MEIRFEIAKKLTKPAPKAAGITLRSIRGTAEDCEASMIIMADSYSDIRDSVTAYKMMRSSGFGCRSRGRSLEIYCEGPDCIDALMDFGLGISFNSEDVMEVLDFYAKNMKDGRYRALAIDMSPEDLRLSCEAFAEDGTDPEDIYSAAAAAAMRFDMGIIK